VWTLEYSKDAEHDFELIFDHLFEAYAEFESLPDEALEKAAELIRKLRAEVDHLVDTPYIGTLRPDIYPEVRFLLRDKAAIWFLPLERSRSIIVVAIFYGAQDHVRHMLTRLLAR
jgi:plasmid stabilization system protein ParE